MNLVPVSRERHQHKCLRPISSFVHAAGTAAIEVVIGELAQIVACYPIFFIRQEGRLKLIALLGLAQGENLFVDGAGIWTGLYVPATLRCFPFTLARQENSDNLTVMIDEDSGLLADDGGEALFGNDEGEPNGPLARAIQLLGQINAEATRTQALAKQLDDLGLLTANSLQVERGGAPQAFSGILSVDESALNALSDEAFLTLRHSGALVLAQAQMLSLGQLAGLQLKANLRDGLRVVGVPS